MAQLNLFVQLGHNFDIQMIKGHQKNSYDRSVYESVGERSLS